MATSFDRSVALDRPGSKLRVRLDVLSQNRSANRSHVRIRIEAYNGGNSTTFNNYPGAIVRVSGHGINYDERVTFSIPGGSWFTFYDQNHTIEHAANGRLHLNLTGSMTDPRTNNLGDGGSITLTGSFDPLYLAPTAPSWGSTDYQDPDRVRIQWGNRASARGAYSSIRVQRWARSTGKWYHRAVLSGSATSYTDTSRLSSNDEHRWRVRAEGPGGNSSWVQGGTLGTTPAAATSVRASKAEQGVRVSWADNAAGTNRPRTFYIDDNPDGTGWVRVGEIGGSATSWAHADADPAVTHQYRVWARITSQIDLTSSASDPSNTVQLQAAPDQPWREAPLDGTVQTVGVPFTLEWLHRPVDTTGQTAAEVQWRIDGGAWTTETVTGPEQALEVDPTLPGARAQFEWRVRTKGAHPDWSPWSTINGPRISTPPVIAIQAPTNGEELATSRVTASWTYTPGGAETQLAQAEWKVSLFLWDSGTLIEQRSGTTAEQVALGTRLENGIEYVLTVAVRNGDGLWSGGETARFTTDFPVPAEVMVEPRWDHDTAAVSIGFHESEEPRGDTLGITDVDAIDVERREPDGTWTLIASAIDTSSTITDRTPHVGDVEYRAVSRTTLPTETEGPAATAAWVHDRDPVYVNGGDGMGQQCLARGADATDAHAVDQALHRFAGQERPVAFFGTGQEHKTSFTGKILPHYHLPVSDRAEWVALLRERGLVCFRDCTGRKVFGVLAVSFTQTGNVQTVSLEVEEAQYVEGVPRVSDLELEARVGEEA